MWWLQRDYLYILLYSGAFLAFLCFLVPTWVLDRSFRNLLISEELSTLLRQSLQDMFHEFRILFLNLFTEAWQNFHPFSPCTSLRHSQCSVIAGDQQGGLFLPLRFDTSQLCFVANLYGSVSLETAFSMSWMQKGLAREGRIESILVRHIWFSFYLKMTHMCLFFFLPSFPIYYFPYSILFSLL